MTKARQFLREFVEEQNKPTIQQIFNDVNGVNVELEPEIIKTIEKWFDEEKVDLGSERASQKLKNIRFTRYPSALAAVTRWGSSVEKNMTEEEAYQSILYNPEVVWQDIINGELVIFSYALKDVARKSNKFEKGTKKSQH